LSVLGRIPVLRLRPRSLWRKRAPLSPEEIRRTERWLATARVFLAISALVAVWMDPKEVKSVWAYALLAFYILQGTAIIFLLRSRQQSTASFRFLVHGADIVWPALISLFTTGQSSPFFLFFLFVIAAAAYRWGLWETVATAVSSVSLLWLESLVLRLGRIEHINLWLQGHHLPVVRVDAVDFEPKRLFMRSVYLIVMGLLLGYLAEQQKKLRAEKDVTARLLGLVRMDAGLGGTLSEILAQLLRMYGSQRALVASREAGNPRVSVGALELKEGIAQLQWMDPGLSGSETYLGASPAATCYAKSRTGQGQREFEAMGLDSEGALLRDLDTGFLQRFAETHAFQNLIAVSFSFGPELSGRLFLMEPTLSASFEEELHFLQDLARQVGPAVYNLYLLRRLRRRAGALERARLSRELHDGAVQSLIGVEMQVDVLRRSYPGAESMGDELDRIQKLLREEVLKLRELMQQMKSAEIDARRLPGFLRDTVQRFQRETGIASRFLMDDEEVLLPPPVCRELARIAQEALVNVRKHSGAKQVLVHLLHTAGSWELIIEDDGAGFPFAGRVSQAELDSAGRAPATIRERVRLIHGELTIESKPGQGARVEVMVPQAQAVSS
jgi:signal transduction histidine kinase